VNNRPVSPYPNLASDTRTPKDIIDDILIIPDPPFPFSHACECEKSKMSEDDVSVYLDKFDEWHISDGGESCKENASSNVNLMDSISQLCDFSHNSSVLPPPIKVFTIS